MSERDVIEKELDRWALLHALKAALYIAQKTNRKDMADKILRVLVDATEKR